jgi:hypothetical protein
VSDQWRGTLSAAALFSLLPPGQGFLLLVIDGVTPLPAYLTILALAVLGGLPPLAHLKKGHAPAVGG